MNKRQFLLFTAITAAVVLTGCKEESPSDKFAGYWVASAKFPTYIKITKNGDSFLVNIHVWDNMFKGGYVDRKLAASIDKNANNILVADNKLKFAYNAEKDLLHSGNSTMKRITEDQYNATVEKPKELQK